MSPPALDAVVRLEAPQVIYVSCDPATLARDAARLTARGYRLESIQAFDLFPNTSHVETVVAFRMR
jgi:23S rRNA (uracil1939-C5)-methyltransferase